ncbi:caspase family protein [Polynucleobacter sp. AM-25C3]|uniref:caspase family protein n=1 Tax=Polynucleobacter sp. AM-25C3 TaxID=1855569 RepID=UPI001C0E295E|nr:caspase family protein [Polynucleobacter sp. AM-25C3]MBU3602563.1 SEL1-like repeat protein [Polynucleobacter sp. AM-25C3]
MYKKIVVVSAGIVAAMYSHNGIAGYLESKSAFMRQDYKDAYEQCIQAANIGNPECLNAIGYLYQKGLGVAINLDEANRLFSLAADKNNAGAQYNLAMSLQASGQGSAVDLQKSAKWMLKAAESKNVSAQVNLGTMYSEGKGVEANPSKAVYWWKKAADQGNAMAQNNLGWAYLNGRGVSADQSLAREWLEKAARQAGDDEARTLALNNLKLMRLNKEFGAPKEMVMDVYPGKPDASGKVILTIASENKTPIRLLKVGDKDIGPSSTGTYSITRYVPVGETQIEIYAEGQSGAIYNQHILVRRDMVSGSNALPELDPTKIPSSVRRDAVAIVIGAEGYEMLPRADFSDHDARSFYDYANKSLGVDAQKIKLLSGSSAKRKDILLALRNWLPAEINQGKTEVIIFYSGHGLASADGKKRYLLPLDANVDLLEDTAIAHDSLIKIINGYQPKSITLVMDSCYSGVTKTGKPLLTAARPIAIYSENENIPQNTTILSAASGSQISISSAEIGHGLFSYFIMRGLEGEADLNKDQKITAQELHAYASERVTKEAQRKGVQQNPAISGAYQKVISAQK